MENFQVEMEKVHIKEWKRDVYVKPISFEEQLAWEKSVNKDNPDGGEISTLVSMSVCNESGVPLWDRVQISKLPSKIVQRLYFISTKVSGLRKKDFDAILKNLDADQPE